jgi:hypothetical protein
MSNVNTSRLTVAATAITMAAGLMLPTPAQAQPACNDWEFPGDLTLDQADGWRVQIPVSGTPRKTAGPGQAVYFMAGKSDPSNGTATGGLTGNQINVTVTWSNGSVGKFTGTVAPDGRASGTSNSSSGFSTTWTAAQKMNCLDATTPDSKDPNGQPPDRVPPDEEPPAKAPDEAPPPPDQRGPCIPDPLDLNFPGAC